MIGTQQLAQNAEGSARHFYYERHVFIYYDTNVELLSLPVPGTSSYLVALQDIELLRIRVLVLSIYIHVVKDMKGVFTSHDLSIPPSHTRARVV